MDDSCQGGNRERRGIRERGSKVDREGRRTRRPWNMGTANPRTAGSRFLPDSSRYLPFAYFAYFAVHPSHFISASEYSTDLVGRFLKIFSLFFQKAGFGARG